MYRVRGSSARGNGPVYDNFSPREPQGVSLVDSVSLRSVQSTASSGLKVVNNSPGGGQQFNVIAKVPDLETTWAGTIDNFESWMALYRMMPRGKISVIVAVTPNGSGHATSATALDWSVLQHKKGPMPRHVDGNDNVYDEQNTLDDTSTVVGNSPTPPNGPDDDQEVPDDTSDIVGDNPMAPKDHDDDQKGSNDASTVDGDKPEAPEESTVNQLALASSEKNSVYSNVNVKCTSEIMLNTTFGRASDVEEEEHAQRITVTHTQWDQDRTVDQFRLATTFHGQTYPLKPPSLPTGQNLLYDLYYALLLCKVRGEVVFNIGLRFGGNVREEDRQRCRDAIRHLVDLQAKGFCRPNIGHDTPNAPCFGSQFVINDDDSDAPGVVNRSTQPEDNTLYTNSSHQSSSISTSTKSDDDKVDEPNAFEQTYDSDTTFKTNGSDPYHQKNGLDQVDQPKDSPQTNDLDTAQPTNEPDTVPQTKSFETVGPVDGLDPGLGKYFEDNYFEIKPIVPDHQDCNLSPQVVPNTAISPVDFSVQPVVRLPVQDQRQPRVRGARNIWEYFRNNFFGRRQDVPDTTGPQEHSQA
ncbi:hypothetical protein F53441_4191 [Fusarium austroafricanum]|uniref:Uncharacterized protein n=1 Tax=Fusarium austroafricanum TaxID=2364996 RepID=A0A8H4KMP9_9HYPO|nr:hypothetical protein F53441_4191 [Fusarium austroafricanum]